MSNKLLFSVIVPIYKSEKYIAQCIDSILSQTYDNIELILVDDGSPDNSRLICEDYIKKDKRVKIIHQDNQGQFRARKKGIDCSCGDYIIFVDSDDCIRNDTLEIINKYIDNKANPDVIFYKFCRENNYLLEVEDFPFDDGRMFESYGKDLIYELVISTSSLNSMCTKAYKSQLLKNVCWDDELIASTRIGEDLLQTLPILMSAKSIVYCDNILYYYRENEQSIMNSYNPTRYLSRKLVHNELEKYIKIWALDYKKYIKILNARILSSIVGVFSNINYADGKIRGKLIKEVVSDKWFRDLYVNTDKKDISIKQRTILHLAYHRAYFLLNFVLNIIK